MKSLLWVSFTKLPAVLNNEILPKTKIFFKKIVLIQM